MKKHPAFGGLPGILCPCNMLGPNDFEIVRLNRPSFFPFIVRIKNMFLFDEGRAKKQFHYRTVMMNWLFTPDMTYQELATKSMEFWNRYLDHESVPGFGCKDPFESWGTWCVTRPGKGKRMDYILMLRIMYAMTSLSLLIQEGSDQGRHELPDEPGACRQTSAVYR
jgi:hypothetical protein